MLTLKMKQILLLLVSLAPLCCSGTIYGLLLEHNAPSEVGLVTVDSFSGNVTRLGDAHKELDGMGDLSPFDPLAKIFYYLVSV